MRDWKMLVQQRLGTLSSNPEEQEAIVAELVCHLEDVYESERAQGHCESEAMRRALDEISEGHKLGRKIRKSREGQMNERTRKFWLPAFASVAAACAFVAVVAQLSYLPRVILFRSEVAALVYPIWILGQLPLGALGAYCSRRAGGDRLTRITAGVFPSIVMATGILVVVVVQFILRGKYDFGSVDTGMFARALVSVVLVPTIVLMLGTLPFLKNPEHAA